MEDKRDIPRIDVIGQNGADGEIYKVEKICRIMAGDSADLILGGKNDGKRRWQIFVPVALKIIEALEND